MIDDFNSLILEEKEFALDLIQKILVESKRKSLLSKSRKADLNLKNGKTKMGSVKDLYNDLEND